MQHEMDGGIRRNQGAAKQAGRAESMPMQTMLDHRPLKSFTLAPPDYKIPHQVLSDNYIEKEVKFAGVIPNIPIDLDCTNRTDVLRVIDRGKQDKLIPWTTTYEGDNIFFLNVHNIKISKRDGVEELILRLPIHEIAASCYIRDADQHILAIKFGTYKMSLGLSSDDNPEMCQLAVLYCENRVSAEELCSLIGQCFQLVYTEATIHFLDSKVSEAAAGLSIGSSTVRSDKSSANSTPKRERVDPRSFLTQSNLELDQMNGAFSALTTRSLQRPPTTRRSSTTNESELSNTANDMIQDYMIKIYNKLNHEELRRFAMLFKAWNATMAFSDFCEQVLELYGPERKHLLLGMRPFIPEKDTATFEMFLERIGLSGVAIWSETMTPNVANRYSRNYNSTSPGNNHGTTSSSHSAPTSGNGDEYDQQLNAISDNIESLSTSVTMNFTSDSVVPKTT